MTRSHKTRLRHPQPGRVDQVGLLRPQRRRHLLLLEVPDQRRRVRRRRGERRRTTRRSTRAPATSPTPRPSRWRPSTPPKHAGAELVPVRLQRRSLRDRQPLRDQAAATYEKAFQGSLGTVGQAQDHLALGHARPGRQRGRVDRHDHRAAVRSQRRTAGSGDACTAASPTPPSTSSGSRRSACSRRTTPSSPPPTPGSASASACSAT